VGRSAADLAAVKVRILTQTLNARVQVFVADVSDAQAVKEVVEGTVRAFGRLDVAVESAGKADPWKKRGCLIWFDLPFFLPLFSFIAFTEYDPDNWWKTMEVNIRGVYNVAQCVILLLILN
jgi:NAD(P)-dependent dehydrogenase (short-subunit alcohol dehydrogenase family)